MFKLLLALHLIAAIFAIGPLAQAAKSASRGIRRGEAAETVAGARLLRLYSYASVVVVLLGMGLMSVNSPFGKGKVAEFDDTWIWLSLLLWAVAIAICLLYLVPTLTKATETIRAEGSVLSLTVRVATAGVIVGLIFTGIVFLMVYRPGS